MDRGKRGLETDIRKFFSDSSCINPSLSYLNDFYEKEESWEMCISILDKYSETSDNVTVSSLSMLIYCANVLKTQAYEGFKFQLTGYLTDKYRKLWKICEEVLDLYFCYSSTQPQVASQLSSVIACIVIYGFDPSHSNAQLLFQIVLNRTEQGTLSQYLYLSSVATEALSKNISITLSHRCAFLRMCLSLAPRIFNGLISGGRHGDIGLDHIRLKCMTDWIQIHIYVLRYFHPVAMDHKYIESYQMEYHQIMEPKRFVSDLSLVQNSLTSFYKLNGLGVVLDFVKFAIASENENIMRTSSELCLNLLSICQVDLSSLLMIASYQYHSLPFSENSDQRWKTACEETLGKFPQLVLQISLELVYGISEIAQGLFDCGVEDKKMTFLRQQTSEWLLWLFLGISQEHLPLCLHFGLMKTTKVQSICKFVNMYLFSGCFKFRKSALSFWDNFRGHLCPTRMELSFNNTNYIESARPILTRKIRPFYKLFVEELYQSCLVWENENYLSMDMYRDLVIDSLRDALVVTGSDFMLELIKADLEQLATNFNLEVLERCVFMTSVVGTVCYTAYSTPQKESDFYSKYYGVDLMGSGEVFPQERKTEPEDNTGLESGRMTFPTDQIDVEKIVLGLKSREKLVSGQDGEGDQGGSSDEGLKDFGGRMLEGDDSDRSNGSEIHSSISGSTDMSITKVSGQFQGVRGLGIKSQGKFSSGGKKGSISSTRDNKNEYRNVVREVIMAALTMIDLKSIALTKNKPVNFYRKSIFRLLMCTSGFVASEEKLLNKACDFLSDQIKASKSTNIMLNTHVLLDQSVLALTYGIPMKNPFRHVFIEYLSVTIKNYVYPLDKRLGVIEGFFRIIDTFPREIAIQTRYSVLKSFLYHVFEVKSIKGSPETYLFILVAMSSVNLSNSKELKLDFVGDVMEFVQMFRSVEDLWSAIAEVLRHIDFVDQSDKDFSINTVPNNKTSFLFWTFASCKPTYLQLTLVKTMLAENMLERNTKLFRTIFRSVLIVGKQYLACMKNGTPVEDHQAIQLLDCIAMGMSNWETYSRISEWKELPDFVCCLAKSLPRELGCLNYSAFSVLSNFIAWADVPKQLLTNVDEGAYENFRQSKNKARVILDRKDKASEYHTILHRIVDSVIRTTLEKGDKMDSWITMASQILTVLVNCSYTMENTQMALRSVLRERCQELSENQINFYMRKILESKGSVDIKFMLRIIADLHTCNFSLY